MIALHGADAAVHDYHSGRAGSFVEAIAALAAAHQRGEAIEVATAITRSSYRGLARLPPLLHAHGVARWTLAVATFAEPDRFVPRLAMALPFALHAIDRAVRLGIAATIVDAPRCLLGPHAALAIMTEPRSYPAPCEHCAARPQCPGIEAAYVARFGAGELTTLGVADRGRP